MSPADARTQRRTSGLRDEGKTVEPGVAGADGLLGGAVVPSTGVAVQGDGAHGRNAGRGGRLEARSHLHWAGHPHSRLNGAIARARGHLDEGR